jgi:hypothetical protein
MTTALKVNLTTGEALPVEIHGNDDVLKHFKGHFRGKTLQEVSPGILLREWKSVDPKAERIAILDAYDSVTLKRVDLPELTEFHPRNISNFTLT